MLITHNLSLLRILRTTWKVDVLLLLTCVATYCVHAYLIPKATQIPATLSTLLGTAIAFFVGFNNNQAFDRWWEARIIWGALVNDSRSWARNVLHYTTSGRVGHEEVVSIQRRMVRRHIGFVYALKETLRKKPDGYYEQFLSEAEREKVKQESNVPNAILTLYAADLQRLSDYEAVDPFRFVQFNDLITAFTDHMGKSERIRNTVFPTTYVYFTRLFIWVLVVFTTLLLADSVGRWSIVLGWVIGFIFHVTHQNGMGLMDPFEDISTAIPLNQISRTIEINLLQMLGEKDVPAPVGPVNNEYIP